MKKKLTIVLLAVTMVLTSLVGCGTKAPVSTDEPGEVDTSAEIPAETPSKEGNFKVGIALQSLENAYWAGVFGEVEALFKEKGWEYTILGAKDNSATQIEQIENFITNQVDLIMVHPSDPNAIEDYLKAARDAGIKVMSWDDKMINTDLNWVLDNAELGYEIGAAAGEFINEHYSEDNMVEVAILNYPQTPILLDRENGIMKGLEEVAGGKFKVVAQQPALDASTALSSMETILQANPDVKVVCSIGAGGDIGANEAFMTAAGGNVPEDVGVFSADATEQQLQAIENGEASRTSVGFEGSNKRTAAAVVDVYERLLNGEEFEDQDVYRPLLPINASNVSEYLADFK